MRRGWRSLVGVALLVAGVGCSSDGSLTGPSVSAGSGSYTVSGNVVENTVVGKRPSLGSRVVVAFPGGNREAQTDKDGHFSLAGIPGGTIQVFVSKYGYDDASQQVELGGDQSLFLELWRSERQHAPRPI